LEEDDQMAANYRPETLALHAGWRADPATGAVAPPIYQTTSYQFQRHRTRREPVRAQGAGQHLHPHRQPDDGRAGKAHRRARGRRRGAGGGVGAGGVGLRDPEPGQAGDNVVSSTDLYGGTWNLFANTLRDQGIEVRFVDPSDPDAFRAPPTSAPAPITPRPCPIRSWVVPDRRGGRHRPAAGHSADRRQHRGADPDARPLDHGAAIVVYSATKYIGGHGTSIGGLIVDGGNFDWDAHPARQPALNTPDPSYHGAVWTQAVKPLGPIAYIIKARAPCCCVTSGAALSPFNAFQILQGIETCRCASSATCKNASKPSPGFWPSGRIGDPVIHPRSRRARRGAGPTLSSRADIGGLVGFELAGREAGGASSTPEAALPRGQYRRRAQPGDPSGLDHALAAERRGAAATGVTPGYVRLSIGIEHIDDILADLEQALAAAGLPWQAVGGLDTRGFGYALGFPNAA
jgi:O-acetylhomoserine (thiol)-lyase